jgi:type II pantothenate kinase
MIANNCTQLAFLHCEKESIHNVFFTGGFVRDNPVVWGQISRALAYWSQDRLSAHFLEHEGYLGALGAASLHENSI